MKIQPNKRGVRPKTLQHDKQSVSKKDHTLGPEIPPSPTTDKDPKGQKLPTPQSKRKRQEVSTEETGERKPTDKPSARHPLRRSARLQEQCDRALREGGHQLSQIPSPARSSSLDRKRQKTNTEDFKANSSRPEKPRTSADGSKATSTPAAHYDPLETWIKTGNWPSEFAEKGFDIGHSKAAKNPNTQPRMSSYEYNVRNEETSAQCEVPDQQSILAKGLDMSLLKEDIRKVLENCQMRNKAFVHRIVTPQLVPPIMSLYIGGADYLEHVVDEVTTDWDIRCVLAGPPICPDLAIGFGSSAFTSVEIDKLNNYTATDNWTRFTEVMYFPFLMCEVMCADQTLDTADRQNMHSSSVAVRALLRIEQEADKYRLKKKMARLNGRILVFSISHDPREFRLYGHYAMIHDEQWTYHRYCINTFRIFPSQDELLDIHIFVQNLLKIYQPELLQQLKEALAALPKPGQSSSPAGGTTLTGHNSQKRSQNRDADRFAVPGAPASALRSGDSAAKQQIDRLVQQLKQQRQENMEREEKMEERQKQQLEQQRQENMEREEKMEERQKQHLEQQRQENKEREEKMEHQKQENKEREEKTEKQRLQQVEQQRQENERLHRQLSELMALLTSQRTTTP